jgi:hypothetical protein
MAFGRQGVGWVPRLCQPWPAAAGALCLSALLLAGCSGGAQVADNRDPLKGNQPPLPVVAKGEIKPVPLAGGATPYAIQPAPSSATSTAALASAGTGQRNGGQDLRGGAAATATPASTGPVTLSAPQVVKDTATPAHLQAIIPAGGPGMQSIDQALKELQSRGVQGFRLERLRDTGKWRCICVVPSPEAPAVKQTYDIQDAADPLSALRAVLEQVEQNSH